MRKYLVILLGAVCLWLSACHGREMGNRVTGSPSVQETQDNAALSSAASDGLAQEPESSAADSVSVQDVKVLENLGADNGRLLSGSFFRAGDMGTRLFSTFLIGCSQTVWAAMWRQRKMEKMALFLHGSLARLQQKRARAATA